MPQRDALLVLGGVVFATLVSVLLLSSVLVAPQPQDRRVQLGKQPVPTARPVPELIRRLPPQFQFLAPVVPVQRGVGQTAREFVGLLLVLVLTAGTLVVAREQVVRAHAASAGGFGSQARVFGVGVGIVFAVASALLLGWFLLTGTVVSAAAALAQPGAQGQAMSFLFVAVIFEIALFAAIFLVLGAITLVGFSAAAWRVGAGLLGIPLWRRIGAEVPSAVAALFGATLLYIALYLAAEVPVAGPIAGALVLAYSLGAFVLGRLQRAERVTVLERYRAGAESA